ncbi:MAG: Sapep family Mn(2+)-dependent dipeptidase [Clostridia bacterium]|nr:Sapep family Mn(2+)-dependent dipeptidase [Clostridia bacterium]
MKDEKTVKRLNDIDAFLKTVKEEYVSDLASLIAIRSVTEKTGGEHVFGEKCAEVLEKALEIGNKYGFETENCEYYCGSILFRQKGEKEVGIVGHLDVVPEGNGWSYDPFRMTVENGLMIGRGTEDDKGPVVAGLYAMRYLKERGIELPFSVRLIMGCNEEAGMEDLPHYVETRKTPDFSFTPDTSFPVCVGEKGIGTIEVTLCENASDIIDIKGGTVKNAVPDRAYAVVRYSGQALEEKEGIVTEISGDAVIITAFGETAHAAMPETGKNAIGMLCSYIIENGLAPKDADALSFAAKSASEYYGSTLGIDCSDKESGYLTCVGSLIRYEEGKIIQTFNIRLPVTKTWENAISRFDALTKEGRQVKWLSRSEPYYISPDKKEIQCLLRSCEDVVGEKMEPYTMGGGTYARHFPNTVAFGATIYKYRNELGEGRGHAHDRDEYLSVAEFESAVKIFVLSLLRLGGME